MERRSPNTEAATAVMDTMTARGVSVTTLSKATDISERHLKAILSNRRAVRYGWLSDVSGFFGLPITHFIKGAHA